MDPDAALTEIRSSVGRIRDADDDDTLGGSEIGCLLDMVEALDEWLSKGGFPPTAWMYAEPRRLPGARIPAPRRPGDDDA